jgi:hypothetical protein
MVRFSQKNQGLQAITNILREMVIVMTCQSDLGWTDSITYTLLDSAAYQNKTTEGYQIG